MTCRVSLLKLSKLVLLAVVLAALAAQAADYRYLVYVGTYTDKGSKGIYAYRFDPVSGGTEAIGVAAETANPSFPAVEPNHKYLYAVNEIDNFSGGHTGAVAAFAIEPDTGKLTPCSRSRLSAPDLPTFRWTKPDATSWSQTTTVGISQSSRSKKMAASVPALRLCNTRAPASTKSVRLDLTRTKFNPATTISSSLLPISGWMNCWCIVSTPRPVR